MSYKYHLLSLHPSPPLSLYPDSSFSVSLCLLKDGVMFVNSSRFDITDTAEDCVCVCLTIGQTASVTVRTQGQKQGRCFTDEWEEGLRKKKTAVRVNKCVRLFEKT